MIHTRQLQTIHYSDTTWRTHASDRSSSLIVFEVNDVQYALTPEEARSIGMMLITSATVSDPNTKTEKPR